MLELFGAAPEPHLMISLSNVRLQLEFSLIYMGFPVAQMVKNVPAMRETQVQSLGQEDTLEKEMETHFSILAWEIPWTEEPSGLQLQNDVA